MNLLPAEHGSGPANDADQRDVAPIGLAPAGFSVAPAEPEAWSGGPLSGSEPGGGVGHGRATLATLPTEWARREVLDACLVASRRMGGASLTIIGVTSSLRGEGRSTVAAALAAIQALEYERKTMLVEFDLDKPSAAARFSLDEGPGVAEVLRGEHAIEECLQWPSDNLAVMVAGRVGESHADLLRTSVAESLVGRLSILPEVLVLDLPPLIMRIGGAQLADLCPTVVLVVRAGVLTVSQIEDAAATLACAPFVILNGTNSATPRWIRRMLGTAE